MKRIPYLLIAAAVLIALPTQAQEAMLPETPVPQSITVDQGLSAARATMMQETALAYYAFWNTGKKHYLDRAVASQFIDNTLPPGRPQGPAGPLYASTNFRKAVPDLRCTVNDLLITDDKVTVRMQFTGTFTGSFGNVQGQGQPVSFLAIDILRIRDAKIIEDWHLEDNLTLMQQLGVVH
ncbi:Predicted ester cyclase [Catalinimonas alkaloidigena]|uniref:Predicted ester cyclase n=1 Tax=Catalinimonas alkaloidigena TaxID=1075417 RepID=A0A1G9P4F6_9BACT|nr:ester cyclase [Catalinimonas alkaloidigena]SDL93594.1 Predicted ester cyclase [Catalinimonas alkaloidigena]